MSRGRPSSRGRTRSRRPTQMRDSVDPATASIGVSRWVNSMIIPGSVANWLSTSSPLHQVAVGNSVNQRLVERQQQLQIEWQEAELERYRAITHLSLTHQVLPYELLNPVPRVQGTQQLGLNQSEPSSSRQSSRGPSQTRFTLHGSSQPPATPPIMQDPRPVPDLFTTGPQSAMPVPSSSPFYTPFSTSSSRR